MANTIKKTEIPAFFVKEQIPPVYRIRERYSGPRLLTVLFSLLVFIALLHFIIVAHMNSAANIPLDCQGLLRTTDYTSVVHLQAGKQEMEAVQFASQVTGKQPAALVQILNSGPQQKLDVYVFGCTMQKHTPRLTTLLAERGLVQGSASISAANTLVTSEQDTTLPAQAIAVEQPMQQNIYREYAWQHGTLLQVAFPGLYPVASRGEAEQLQQQANTGQSLTWSDPLATAEQMAKDILKWPHANAQDSVLSTNGLTASVQLISQNPPMTVIVILQRLIQHDNQGLWFVTDAHTPGIRLDHSHLSTPAPSPLTLQGTGALPGGQTTATLFDHTLNPIPLLNNPVLTVDANGHYSGSLFFAPNLANQQGLLLIQSLPTGGSQQCSQLLLTGVTVGSPSFEGNRTL